ncbi:hypothetical protein [Chitinophaga japonensis]|uniref:Uncharacterized protein n=1 Tax=Chitinophaga japonensis TaxID=104662 RepID=A0A562T0E9_CHIJA|nr:hypothetical protein [Chitinophaga japonensis]TWI87009.1 hypothetical protein LX66_4277 [Chitinophaga japonensis]
MRTSPINKSTAGASPVPQGNRSFFQYGPGGAFFRPAHAAGAAIQKKDGPGKEDAAQTADSTKGREPAKEPETKIGFGSLGVFCQLFDDLVLQFPARWKQSYERAKREGTNRLFDPAFGKKLISDEIMSLWNIFYAIQYSTGSPYGKAVDFSKGLEMAEQITGVSDTYIHLVSIALHMDMKKYLSDKIPGYAKENLGIFLISGALLQAGLAGVNALTESDVDIFSLVGPATASFTEAPAGLKRPSILNNIPDPRWKYPFWQTPDKLELKYTGLNPDAGAATWNLSLGLNIASMMDLYPKDEKEKKKYKGFELYPYFNYVHNAPVEGKPAPAEEHRFLAGFFAGNKGFYTLLEGGARLDGKDPKEVYGRLGGVMQHFGPLSLLQLTGEMNYRPDNDAGLRGRINAATSFELLDNDQWQLKLGGSIGGLLPSGEARGAVDFGANLLLNYKYKGLATGADVTFNMGRQDPFDASSPAMYGMLGRLTFFDMLKIGMEYYKINQQHDTLPDKDLRGFIAIDFAPVFMRKRKP